MVRRISSNKASIYKIWSAGGILAILLQVSNLESVTWSPKFSEVQMFSYYWEINFMYLQNSGWLSPIKVHLAVFTIVDGHSLHQFLDSVPCIGDVLIRKCHRMQLDIVLDIKTLLLWKLTQSVSQSKFFCAERFLVMISSIFCPWKLEWTSNMKKVLSSEAQHSIWNI